MGIMNALSSEANYLNAKNAHENDKPNTDGDDWKRSEVLVRSVRLAEKTFRGNESNYEQHYY
jgi:hypothetical protein